MNIIKKENFIEILKLKKVESKSIIIAIDGKCASGKTTFAEELKKLFDCNIFHTDDFFLPTNKQQLTQIAGNMDLTRFKSEIIDNILLQKDFAYRPFDCKSQQFKNTIDVKYKNISIIEGSYSHHPLLNQNYTVKLVMTTNCEEQKQRIIIRNKERAKIFFEKWVVFEERYFDEYKIYQNCDFIIET